MRDNPSERETIAAELLRCLERLTMEEILLLLRIALQMAA